jgi:Peroxisomal biogenesis factor 11 (PEX11)
MSPLGNGSSVGGTEGLGDGTTVDEAIFTPSYVVTGAEGHGDGDDEGSDPSGVVVSPQSSPNASLLEDNGHEVFQDAKQPGMAVSPSFVQLGVQTKATPFALKSWTSLALTLDGRDKITKLFQYICRLLSWWYASRGSKQLAHKFLSLSSSLSNSRKAFRLGRSLIEIEKLRSMGLGQLILRHLQKSLGYDVERDGEGKTSPGMRLEVDKGPTGEPRPAVVRSLGLTAYRVVSLPLRFTFSSIVGSYSPTSRTSTAADLWIAIGSALKMLGLLGFWAGDNINYVSSTGFLDDYSLPDDERLAKRTHLQTISSVRANQAFFGGSIAGLFANAFAYIQYRRTRLAGAELRFKEACKEHRDDQIEEAQKHLASIKAEQFSLFLALLKSCCDVIVFSNNPGVDLHQKYRGKKNHEGLHCVCGLVSAGTVLFNNFPNKN